MQPPCAIPPLIAAIVQGLARKHQLDTLRTSKLTTFALPHITNPLDVHALYATLEAYIGSGAQALALTSAASGDPTPPTTPPSIPDILQRTDTIAPSSPVICTDDVPAHIPSLAKHEHIILPCDFEDESLSFEQKDWLTEIARQVIYTHATTLVTSRFTQAMRCEILKRTKEMGLAWVWEGPSNYHNIMWEVQLVGMLAWQQFRLDLVGSLNQAHPLSLCAFSINTARKYLPAGSPLLDSRAIGRNAVLRRWVYENFKEIENALIYFNPPPRMTPLPGMAGATRASCRQRINFWGLVEAWYDEKARRWGRDLTRGPWVGYVSVCVAWDERSFGKE
ncbi:hypothetical protein JB92DRAFT_3143548 [Gautieria morchelliformis]|nr:hypothetical protein JB92DRAFT_3143548 [Gautieria morchelliformis]